MLRHYEKFKIISIIIVILFIINFSLTVSIISSISDMKTPEISLDFEIVDISDTALILSCNLIVTNHNNLPINLHNFKIKSRTNYQNDIGTIIIPDTTLLARETKNITTITSFQINKDPLNNLYNTITGSVKSTLLGFIPSNLPISITVNTKPSTFIDAIILPQISTRINSYNLSNQGLIIDGILEIENTNDIGFLLDNLTITLTDENDNILGEIQIQPINIANNSLISQPITANISYQVFNKGKLIIHLNGNAGIIIAGYEASIPFHTTTTITIPNLESFLIQTGDIKISLSADFDFTLTGVDLQTSILINNPTEIPLSAYNLTLQIYRMFSSNSTLIAEDNRLFHSLPPKTETTIYSNFTISYLNLLPDISKGRTIWFEIQLKGDFTIANTTQRIPISINGMISPNVFGMD
ncbi:MAG: hypothetical protein DRN27_05675 [Thermoplasmata archaeon]|nr:MAG: hypothetical protein DRN27_05675 [Thermoplasmata archaeon]